VAKKSHQRKNPKFDEFFQGKRGYFDTIFPFHVYFSHFGNISHKGKTSHGDTTETQTNFF
jgi:hypothetical protein